LQHFSDIGHNPEVKDVVYENSQARERTQILMDLANKENALVIGTGDMSELALGWCTYNGDQMSMYGVNAGIPKTMVRMIVEYVAGRDEFVSAKPYLLDVVATPVSPELLPADSNGDINQKTEDIVGPYELHDFFLYHLLKNGFTPHKVLYLAKYAFAGQYNEETIKSWLKVFLRRFFSQQFKRSCMPDGPQVFAISLSPRNGWRFASDVSCTEWIDSL
jgi:NAD+ synthase (glutamine-hydrolysing)